MHAFHLLLCKISAFIFYFENSFDMTRLKFKTEVIKQSLHNQARVLCLTTPHGIIHTPAFMPVGTRAAVNHLSPFDLEAAGSQIILGGNTYHMLVNPGLEIIEANGGMHRFMQWKKPMLTDSGGYQVFSLTRAGLCRIDDTGAYFKHPGSYQPIHLTPQLAIKTQQIVGADIIMAFDDCVAESSGREGIIAAMERTHRWLIEAKEIHSRSPFSAYGDYQALFGIVQGGYFQDLREKSAAFVNALDLDGIGIGGESIGPLREQTCEVLDWVRPIVDERKVRYPMGVGLSPQDLIDVVAHGADIFDCVAPTRNARHGSLYCGTWEAHEGWLRFESDEPKGRILIKKSQYAKDQGPIMPGCSCHTCQHYSRAYLHFLFRQKASLYYPLACMHNIHVMQETCARMRQLILSE
jgi:queuine tRNA-ribosyltransferase